MKYCWAIFVAVAFAHGQGFIAVSIAPPPVLPPAISGSGGSLLFGSSFSTSGAPGSGYNVCTANSDGSGFRQLTAAASAASTQSVEAVALTSDGRWAAYTLNPGTIHEEVHFLNVAAAPSVGSDRMLYSDPQGCLLPLAVCFGCTYTCLRTPHISDDGSAVLFAQANTPSFLVAKTDGSALAKLPVYSGVLAGSSKRAISSTGQVVFTSTALSATASSAGQVYTMNLDGSNIRKVTQFTDPAFLPQEATISADGSMIAFTLPNAAGTSTIFTIRSNGYDFSAVAAGNVYSPSLSGDGSLLAYIDSGQVVLLKLGPPQLRTWLTKDQYTTAYDATISDDGSRVAFSSAPALPTFLAVGGVAIGTFVYGGYGATAVRTVSTSTSVLQTVYAPRYVYPPTSAVAGSLAYSPGINLTNDAGATASSLPLPQTLAGVSLTIGGRAAPLTSVDSSHISYQVPPDAPIGNDTLQPKFADGVTAAPATVTVAAILPSVLTLTLGAQAVFHGNTGTAVDSEHPATAGEVLVMYASGLGPATPAVPAGTAAPANPPTITVNQPKIAVGTATAPVQFSGLAPGLVGVYQINFVVPAGLKPGAQSLSLSVAGQSAVPAALYIQ